MNPFIVAQLTSLAESIRVLESFSTPSIRKDIQALRESYEAESKQSTLPRREQVNPAENLEFTGSPAKMAFNTLSLIEATLAILETIKDDGTILITAGWIARARQVIGVIRPKITADLRAATASKVCGLYVIVDPEATLGRPVLDVAGSALLGGARIIQYRNKSGNKSDMLATARKLRTLCVNHHAMLIMNDDAALALTSDAHGLHVGQSDMPIAEARRVLAPHQIIGRSNNNIEEVMASYHAGADYLAVGAIFATTTMGKATRPVVGVDLVRRVKSMVDVPVVAIGGINLGNISGVAQAGADSVCVVSAVTQADDPQKATRELVDAMESAT